MTGNENYMHFASPPLPGPPRAQRPALVVRDLCVSYGRRGASAPVVEGLGFELPAAHIGCLLGAIIGGGLALLAEMFDMKISSTEDVERKLGANPIGSVPLIRTASFLGLSQTNPADYLVENSLSAYAESIRYLRAAIAFSDLDSETKTVAICSSLPMESAPQPDACSSPMQL